ncbi:hypothetical protein C8R44DRAFT_890123 [Mycena epipterygia]|nr:hypothetical protein C8R44DRAFT_890123 [Mycena epipterygia]
MATFNSNEWLSKEKRWEDTPAHVQRVCTRAFIVPADIVSQIFPDPGISLRALLDFSLPRPVIAAKDASDTSVFFSKDSPDVVDTPTISAETALLAKAVASLNTV